MKNQSIVKEIAVSNTQNFKVNCNSKLGSFSEYRIDKADKVKGGTSGDHGNIMDVRVTTLG